MSNWYCLPLSAEEVAAGKVDELKEAFGKNFAAAHGPRTMALFKKESGDGVTLFFTPLCGEHAAGLLGQCGAAACERPSLVALQLVVGHHEITYYMP